jgi:hypothetical protein
MGFLCKSLSLRVRWKNKLKKIKKTKQTFNNLKTLFAAISLCAANWIGKIQRNQFEIPVMTQPLDNQSWYQPKMNEDLKKKK